MAIALPHTNGSGLLSRLDRPRPHIAVRHAEPTDAEALHHIMTEPEVVYWTAGLPIAPIAQSATYATDDDAAHHTLVACVGEEVVGMLRLRMLDDARVRHVGRIGPIAVCGAWQGQAVGSSLLPAAVDLADNWLNLIRLELVVYADNASAIALYERHGFVTEGTLRAFAFRAGAYVDAHVMARLRDDDLPYGQPPPRIDPFAQLWPLHRRPS